ncbi:hypothetical protein PS627_04572 [Pseudomonas fluorescens]|nr:hypothetical protein PS627_04572 [Pseudomonas fluorescens]
MLPETSITSSRLESTWPALTERSAQTASGTSSTMRMARVLVLVLPSESVALYVKNSVTMLAPSSAPPGVLGAEVSV